LHLQEWLDAENDSWIDKQLAMNVDDHISVIIVVMVMNVDDHKAVSDSVQ
jgi:hypothetical protein